MLQGQDKWQVWRSLASTFDTCNSVILYTEAQLVPTETSKVELFAQINNSFQMLTIFTKSLILASLTVYWICL